MRRAGLLCPKLLFFCADFPVAIGARPLGCRDPGWPHVCGFGDGPGIFGRFCSLKAALLWFRLRRPETDAPYHPDITEAFHSKRDFTRRFNQEDILSMQECIHRARLAVWKAQPEGV